MSFLFTVTVLIIGVLTGSKSQAINLKIGAIISDTYTIRVLQLALQHINENYVINPDLNFQFTYRIGCENGAGLQYASELYLLENITVLLGPHCPDELYCVTKLSSRWKLPIISYAQTATYESYFQNHLTLARIAPSTSATMNDCITSFIAYFRWKRVSLIYNVSDDIVVSRGLHLTRQLTDLNVQVLSYEIVDANMTLTDFKKLVDIDEIQRLTRVIILIMGDELDQNQQILRYLAKSEISAPQYVILLPWINHDPDQQYPWLTLPPIDPATGHYNGSVVVDERLKADFVGSYVIDADRETTQTGQRFYDFLSTYNLTRSYIRTSYDQFLLYDSLLLYILAVNQSYSQLGPIKGLDPLTIAQNFAGQRFEGASGFVEMDSTYNRIPYYGIYLINESGDFGLRQISTVNPEKYECDSVGDCYRLNVTSIDEDILSDITNRTKEPACGFTGSKCDYSKWYIIAGSISLVIFIIFLIVYLKKQGFKVCGSSNKTVAQISWQIPLDKVESVKTDDRISQKSESDLSIGSDYNISDGQIAIVFNNIVKVKKFKQLKGINFDITEAKFLLSLKNLVHDNINPIIGMCFNNPTNELLVLSKYCPRGTLSEYLHNPEMRMDGKFKTAFLRDIINGLDYLHNAPIGYHGNLTTSNCVIDANFIVKLVSVGMDDILDEWKGNGWIADQVEGEDLRSQAIEVFNEDLLYRAPEFLRKAAPPRTKLIRMSKSEQVRIKIMCRMGDVYSLSIIFFEVLFRQNPFADYECTIEALVNKLRFPSRNLIRPIIPKALTKDHHVAMIQLMQACWSEDPISRPLIKRIKKIFSAVYKVTGGLVDSIIQMMDQHANSLEKQVRERTRLLEEAQLRADRLLAQMIPKDIARDLKLGKPVIPRNFTNSSILFTDIVGFTTICGQSTPMEIVNFLNDLFTGYDAIISQSDAYKVETIGDAYMVVSGVPHENGTENVKITGTIALKMREYLNKYKLPHMPERKMMARWGLSFGPVAAGVVGLIAPRYCLFGDTVNMASRMESTGEPGKIQTSMEFHASIKSRGDLFIMEKRGTIPVKGKGECLTYWLVDYASQDESN